MSFRRGGQGHELRFLILIPTACLLAGCGSPSPPPTHEVTVWQTLGSWSGHGLMQTEGFIGNGALRVVWETRNETAPNTGTFEVNLHSGVSGRPLAQVVDQRGAGHGTAYVSEDPRDFYLLVESTNLDWSVTVEEAIAATAAEGKKR